MANTFTQINIHIVFAVAHRESLIADEWARELYAYLAGACRNRKHYVHAIGGTADHIHLFVGMHPAESISSLVKEIKGQSSRWINEKHLKGAFSWQSGYGAFSCSCSKVPTVKKYIENQREHHKRVSFREEIEDMLCKAGIDYNPEYVMQGFYSPICRVPKGTLENNSVNSSH